MRKFVGCVLSLLMLWSLASAVSINPISINPGGVGNVLIFPYYNARDKNLSFVRLVNVSDYALVVKVRVKEAVESREVMDFVVCMSPKDQFSFWLVNPNLFGMGYDRLVVIRDEKTLGIFGDSDTITLPNNWGAIDAFNAENSGLSDMDRTYEGYIEVYGVRAYKGLHGIDEGMCVKMAKGAEIYYNGDKIRPETDYNKLAGVLMGEMFIFGIGQPYSTYAYKAIALTANSFSYGAGVDWTRQALEIPKLTDVAPSLNDLMAAFSKKKVYAFMTLSSFYSGGTDILFNFILKKNMIDEFAKTKDNESLSKFFTGTKCAFGEVNNPQLDYTSCCVPYYVYLYNDKEQRVYELSPSGRKACYEVAYVPINLRSNKDRTLLETKLTEDTSSVVIPDVLIDETFTKGWVEFEFNKNPEPVIAFEIQGFIDKAFSHILPASYVGSNTYGKEYPSYDRMARGGANGEAYVPYRVHCTTLIPYDPYKFSIGGETGGETGGESGGESDCVSECVQQCIGNGGQPVACSMQCTIQCSQQ